MLICGCVLPSLDPGACQRCPSYKAEMERNKYALHDQWPTRLQERIQEIRWEKPGKEG